MIFSIHNQNLGYFIIFTCFAIRIITNCSIAECTNFYITMLASVTTVSIAVAVNLVLSKKVLMFT